MAKTTNNNARQTHVSPGIYTKEVDLTYAAKSLGITTLGVVGETVKGPAFQPILVDSWRTYQNYFGGTSTEKFRGSQYPKYELPYIAKSYLEESQQLQVCRVLGLSGVNAGAAWLLTAASNKSGKQYTDDDPLVIGVLRSRGEHRKAAFVKPMDEPAGICEDVYEYDKIVYFAKDVKMTQSADLVLGNSCKPGFDQNKKEFTMDVLNYGTFTLVVTTNEDEDEEKKYSVTLNPSDKNYILNVLGTDPSKGDSEIYVEELYDVAIQQLIERGDIDHIALKDKEKGELYSYKDIKIVPSHKPVYDLLVEDESMLTRRYVGRRYLYSSKESVNENNGSPLKVHVSTDKGKSWTATSGIVGHIYTVVPFTKEDGSREYYYGEYVSTTANGTVIIGGTEYQVVDNKVTIGKTEYDVVEGKVTIGSAKYPVTLYPFIYDGKEYSVVKGKVTIDGKEYNVVNGKVTIGETEYDVVEGKVTIEYPVVKGKVSIEYVVENGKVTIDNKEYKVVIDTFIYDGKEYTVVNGKVTIDDKECTVADNKVKIEYTVVDNKVTINGKEYPVNSNKVSIEYSVENGKVTIGERVLYPSFEKNFETEWLKTEHKLTDDTQVFEDAVEVLSDNLTYIATVDEGKTVVRPVTLDFNNYKEAYRYASTPWIVSEMKGSAENVELTKLFRFHTISDGSASNTEVKVSLANIDPENGTFDVLVRSFYDTDSAPVVLERYTQCNLIPGSSNYIAYKIGSTNEDYETRSNYITVEVNETDKTRLSVPAGFLGYPVRCFDGAMVNIGDDEQPKVQSPYFQYNTNVDEEIRINKQYFGISDLTGIDEDILRYKGVEAYNELPEGLSPCFHLDSRILEKGEKTKYKLQQTVSVDGVVYDNWVTVGKSNVTDYGIEPRLGNEDTMFGTIYEDKRYRKFTVAFYGGWDGWDYFRDQRSNDDSFTYNKYRGSLNRISGEGVSFSVIRDPEAYGFDNKAITSDYYAYLYGIRQFANPKSIDINVFATPGIDYVNNKSLVGEAIEMIETERADSVYVITTPDKPSGAGDGVAEMYTPYDAVANLEDSEIDSNYACTYYPWVKYFDQDNSQYIYLPVTKDIVRNFAMTDNTTYPWFAAAGWNRGTVYGVKSKRNLKLAEQDTLYDGRINFINSFPDEGMKLWGDKNLQERESQMNRISKRRLLVHIRKLLAVACVGLLFDPNDNSTVKSFKSAVEPILQDIVKKRGLTDFRIEVDDSQEARDRLELPAKIYLKLLPSLEYITIDFTISPSGVSFDNI